MDYTPETPRYINNDFKLGEQAREIRMWREAHADAWEERERWYRQQMADLLGVQGRLEEAVAFLRQRYAMMRSDQTAAHDWLRFDAEVDAWLATLRRLAGG